MYKQPVIIFVIYDLPSLPSLIVACVACYYPKARAAIKTFMIFMHKLLMACNNSSYALSARFFYRFKWYLGL